MPKRMSFLLISQKPQKILKENICAEKDVILVILHIQCRRKNSHI